MDEIKKAAIRDAIRVVTAWADSNENADFVSEQVVQIDQERGE